MIFYKINSLKYLCFTLVISIFVYRNQDDTYLKLV
nr:hypothetical protein [Bacteroides sp.]